MGEKFPAVSDREVIKALRKAGFEFFRPAKGSHEVWRRSSDGRHTIIPRHGHRNIKRRTLKSIINDMGISVDEFISLLRD